MSKSPFFLSVLLAAALFLSACGSAAAPTSAPAPTMPPATSAPATEAPAATAEATTAATEAVPVTGGTTVAMASSGSFGSILVDDKGMTLYVFEKDTPGVSNCYGGCATNWPPLLTTGNPVAGDGIDASKLGVTQRTDGSSQVTYNGWPLYYYAKDKVAGDTNGQGVGDVWFLLAPDGSEIKGAGQAAPPAAPSPAATASGYQY